MNEFVDQTRDGRDVCEAFRGNALEKRIKVRKVLDS